MKIIINIQKNHFYFLVAFLVILSIGFVIAQTPGVSHHAQEITEGELDKERIPTTLRGTTIAGDLDLTGKLLIKHGTGSCYSQKNFYCRAATVTGSDCIFSITGFDSAGGCETDQKLMDIWCKWSGKEIHCRSLRSPGNECDSATIAVSWLCFDQQP